MVSVQRYHEISESSHRILNPISTEKVLLLGEICGLRQGTTVLDLACGKGEMLCRFAERHGATGSGVDTYAPFLDDARDRAAALGVERLVSFIEGDAADPSGIEGLFDVVSCLGATWIGGGLSGTLRLMRRWLSPEGWLLVGEVYWIEPPPESVRSRYEEGEGFADLAGTLERVERAGFDLVEMVLASQDEWDRHRASEWLNVSKWLVASPDDPDAAEVRAGRDASRRQYLGEERSVLGWGVFILRDASQS